MHKLEGSVLKRLRPDSEKALQNMQHREQYKEVTQSKHQLKLVAANEDAEQWGHEGMVQNHDVQDVQDVEEHLRDLDPAILEQDAKEGGRVRGAAEQGAQKALSALGKP